MKKGKELKISDFIFYSMLFIVFCIMLSVVQNTLYLKSNGTLEDDCVIFMLSVSLTIMLVIMPYSVGRGKTTMLLLLTLLISIISAYFEINNVLSMNIVEDVKLNRILVISTIHILPPIISFVCGKKNTEIYK